MTGDSSAEAATLSRFFRRWPMARSSASWTCVRALETQPGYTQIADQIRGEPVCDGAYRLLSTASFGLALEFVAAGFPRFRPRALPFGVDWLGRVTAFDRARSPKLLLFEPATAQVFEIEEDLSGFFDSDLVDDPETFLATDLLDEWRNAGGADPSADQCVGFEIPLFLGGKSELGNMVVTDLDVYWTLSAQLAAALGETR